MDKEFHYAITGILAHRAGFNQTDAAVIAYAAQYVDDNDRVLQVHDPATGETYTNDISQTMDITQPQESRIQIYPVFHFVPGNPRATTARRTDGETHPLNTTPDSPLANAMMRAAFNATPKASRLYRIGIAAHAYADTWAHQNFVGIKDAFNGLPFNPLPNIGHADALHHPDWVAHRWTDERLVHSEIDNNERFLAAAERLFHHFAHHTHAARSWNRLRRDLEQIMGPSRRGQFNRGQRARQAQYAALAPWLPKHSRRTWRDAAIRTQRTRPRHTPGTKPRGQTRTDTQYFWKTGKEKTTTHWYQFQQAVKAHHAELWPKVERRWRRVVLITRATQLD